MFVYTILIVAIMAVLAQSKVVRMSLNKKDDSEFVRNIVAQAKEGVSTKHRLGDSGSVVIKDYQNSQYYGEITL
jgi:hypothetical protein